MSNDNKEKTFPEEKLEEKELDTEIKPEENSEGDWKWDAAVPETKTDDITVDELKKESDEPKPEKSKKKSDENQPKQDDKEEEKIAKASDKDDGRCIVCGKLRGDSPSDLYCNSCRKKYLRTSYGVGAVILAFVMVFLSAISYCICVSTVQLSNHIYKAQSNLEAKLYDDVADEYTAMTDEVESLNTSINAVFSGIFTDYEETDFFVAGDRSNMIFLRTLAQTLVASEDELNTFIQYVDTIVGSEMLEKPKNADIKKVYDFANEIIDYTALVAPEWQKFIETAEDSTEITVKYDEAMKYLESCEVDTPAKKTMNYYYRFLTAFYSDKENSVVIDFFAKAYEASGEYSYMLDSAYMSALWQKEEYTKLIEIADNVLTRTPSDSWANYYAIRACILLGDFDEADERCEQMKKAAPDDLDYYGMKAEILRRQNKLEESVNICTEGIAAGSDPEIHRQQAISYMLLGNKTSALEAAETAYQILLQNIYAGSEVSLEAMNTCALIFYLCESSENFEEIENMFTEAEMTFEESVLNCIKGDITFEEIFMEGVGDV